MKSRRKVQFLTLVAAAGLMPALFADTATPFNDGTGGTTLWFSSTNNGTPANDMGNITGGGVVGITGIVVGSGITGDTGTVVLASNVDGGPIDIQTVKFRMSGVVTNTTSFALSNGAIFEIATAGINSFDAAWSGSGSLLLNSTGALSLSNVSLDGLISLNSGTLSIDAGHFVSGTSLSLAANTTAAVYAASTSNFAGVSGAGNLSFSGPSAINVGSISGNTMSVVVNSGASVAVSASVSVSDFTNRGTVNIAGNASLGTLSNSGTFNTAGSISATAVNLGAGSMSASSITTTGAFNITGGQISSSGILTVGEYHQSGGVASFGGLSTEGDISITGGSFSLHGDLTTKGTITVGSNLTINGTVSASAYTQTGGATQFESLVTTSSGVGQSGINLTGGSLTLSGPYTGAVALSNATLNINAASPLSCNGGISGVGVFNVNGNVSVSGDITMSGTINISSGSTLQNSPSSTFVNGAANVVLASDTSSFIVSPGSGVTMTLSSVVGSGTIINNGAGSFSLNSLGAQTRVNVQAGSAHLPSITANTIVAATGSTLYVDASRQTGVDVFTGNLSGGGDFYLVAGTLDVTGAQAFGVSGAYRIDGGELIIPASTISLATGSVNVAESARISLVTTGTSTLAGDITGAGKLAIQGTGTLIVDRDISVTGAVLVRSGTLQGNFRTHAPLIVENGGTLAPRSPGNAPVIGGDFTLRPGATLSMLVGITQPASSPYSTPPPVVPTDFISVSGKATLAGALVATDYKNTFTRGVPVTLITATGGVSGQFASVVVPGATPGFGAQIETQGNSVLLWPVIPLSLSPALAGKNPSFLMALGKISAPDTNGIVSSPVGFALNKLPDSQLSQAVAGLSPDIYASLYDAQVSSANSLRKAVERRLMDDRNAPKQSAFFVFGDGRSLSSSGDSAPSFDATSYGGGVGYASGVEGGEWGVAVGYENASAKYRYASAKMDSDQIHATIFGSTMLSKRWYIDYGVFGGYSMADVSRSTLSGEVSSKPDGFDCGAFTRFGAKWFLTPSVLINPYAGLSYGYHSFAQVDESGANSRLALGSWDRSCLQAEAGAQIETLCRVKAGAFRLGLDAFYTGRLLDTDARIPGTFATGESFVETSKAFSSDFVTAAPYFAFRPTRNSDFRIGFSYSAGFSGESELGANAVLSIKL